MAVATPGIPVALAVPFCTEIKLVLHASATDAPLAEALAEAIVCWTWSGNLTALWERGLGTTAYSGELDAVATKPLVGHGGGADGTGTGVGGSEYTWFGKLDDAVDVSDLSNAMRVQTSAGAAALSYATVLSLQGLVGQARGLVDQRAALGDEDLPRDDTALREALGRAAMDTVDAAAWLRNTLLSVTGNVAAGSANVDVFVDQASERAQAMSDKTQVLLAQARENNARFTELASAFRNNSKDLAEYRAVFQERLSRMRQTTAAFKKVALPPNTVAKSIATKLQQDSTLGDYSYDTTTLKFQQRDGGPLGALVDRAGKVLAFGMKVLTKLADVLEDCLEKADDVLDGGNPVELATCGGLAEGIFDKLFGFLQDMLESVLPILCILLLVTVAILAIKAGCQRCYKRKKKEKVVAMLVAKGYMR
jgi:hypothetical protein